MTQAAMQTQLSGPVTLFEDWKLRRSRLEAFKPLVDKKLIDLQLSLLDHLLERHSFGHEALHAARFPLPHSALFDDAAMTAGALILNRRALVVHHHFRHAGRLKADVEIGQRVVPVVRRLSRRRPRPVKALFDEAAARNVDCEIPIYREMRLGATLAWSAAAEYVTWTGEVFNGYVQARFAPRLGPGMDDELVAYLSKCAERPRGSSWLAVGLLQCCDNASVVEYGVAAWRARLMKRPPDTVLKLLEDALCQPTRRRKVGDKIRVELASQHAPVRTRALVMLERLGNLDDINLLMDLACLPAHNDEGPRERDAILRTMWELSGFSGWNPPLGARAEVSRGGIKMSNGPNASISSSLNLYDDWLRRRRRLALYTGPFRRAFVEGECQVLDFLLDHYRGSARTAKAARFPAPGEVFTDHRAMVVFHHLGKTEVVGVKTEQEASKRASLILRRMASMDLQGSAKSFSQEGRVESTSEPARVGVPKPATAAQLELWERIEEELAIRGPKSHCNLIFKKLEESLQLGAALPEKGVYYLSCQIANPDAIDLLSRCDNKTAIDYAIGIWRRRAAMPPPSAGKVPRVPENPPAGEERRPSRPIPKARPSRRLGPSRLAEFFLAPERREQVAEKFRREILSAENSVLRLNAIRILGRTGSLDDVSLLSDLLSLPRAANEDPRERPAILKAMQRVSGIRHGKLDATENQVTSR